METIQREKQSLKKLQCSWRLKLFVKVTYVPETEDQFILPVHSNRKDTTKTMVSILNNTLVFPVATKWSSNDAA